MKQVIHAHVIDGLRQIPDRSVQCVVTSPPYWALRDYGLAPSPWQSIEYSPMAGLPTICIPEGLACLGLETTPEAFVGHMLLVFREVYRVLADDGVCWVNIGDTYNSHPGQRKSTDLAGAKQRTNAGSVLVGSSHAPSIRAKDLVGIPWRLAFALQSDGWILRQSCIWHKPSPLPESVTDRCTKSHENVFLLAKQPKYYFDASAIAEPCVKGAAGSEFHTGKTGDHQQGRASTKPRANGGASFGKQNHDATGTGQQSRTYDRPVYETRNCRDVWPFTEDEFQQFLEWKSQQSVSPDVWRVASRSYHGAHFAVMPPQLAERCVLSGSRPGDTVLDPFAGSGTTLAVAIEHGRHAVGVELNPDYLKLIDERLSAVQPPLTPIPQGEEEPCPCP